MLRGRRKALLALRQQFSSCSATTTTTTKKATTKAKSKNSKEQPCSALAIIADAGHGLGPFITDAFLNYADMYFFVAAATTSESAKIEMQDQFASYFLGERLSIERLDLKSHVAVGEWKDKILFTHGRTPDIVVANVGKLPQTVAESMHETSCAPRMWAEKPQHWARSCDDMKGVLNVQSAFAGTMVCGDEKVLGKGWMSLRSPEECSCHVRPRKIVNVTQVIHPPCVHAVAPYRVSLASIQAATKMLARDFKGEKAEEEVICASIDPGCLPGMTCGIPPQNQYQPVQKDKLRDEQFEKHGITEREKYTQWAKAFVPFVLNLEKPQNGKALHLPGFPGVPALKY
ncbi:unnamed protein product [Bathycoccus prasinos]